LTGNSDEDLLTAIQAGDTQSLGLLVTRWEQPLFRFVYRILPAYEDARDVCQETFLRVFKKAHRFKRGSRVSTWMYQIALNLCRDHARRKRRWSLLVDEGRELAELPRSPDLARLSDTDPAGAAERNELATAVRRAVERLPAEQREVLILKEFEGLKFREIAEILGCPESTAKSRLYHGLSGVRASLAREGITTTRAS
jgi:RNA polymerase sigma-70 factor, ECF subfamily